jgi:hypothetical protein
MSRVGVPTIAALLLSALLATGTAVASSSPWHQTPCGSSTANDYGHDEPIDYQVDDPVFSGTALVVAAASEAGYADITVSPNSSRVAADGGNDTVSGSGELTPTTQRVCVGVGDQRIVVP